MHDSLVVYGSLAESPLHFLQLLTRSSLENVPEHLEVYRTGLFIEWHVAEYHMVRLFAILNVFSFGNAWGNIILLALLCFCAEMALYRTIIHHFDFSRNGRSIVFGVLFFLPSTLFWSSGLLKEGPVLILLCFIMVQVISWQRTAGSGELIRRIFILAICFVALYGIRDYVALLCLINLMGIVIASTGAFFRKRRVIVTAAFSGLTVAAIIIGAEISGSNSFYVYLQQEQHYFTLGAPDPEYQFELLDGTPQDVLFKVPYVLNNVLFRPNILHSNDLFRVYQSIELMLVWGIILFLLLKRRKFRINHPAAVFCIFLCLELLFIFGLMVNDADTLSRYRSIPVLGLLLLLVTGVYGTTRPIKQNEGH